MNGSQSNGEEESDQFDEEEEGEEEGEDEMLGNDDSPIHGESQPKAVSNADIRKDLESTIDEATKECKDQESKNIKLQMEIATLRRLNHSGADKGGELNMSEVKYANTLAKVHQIRLDLNQTKEKYSKMSIEMKEQLTQKLAKCNEIKATFMELKREVSKKAVFSKRNKGIPETQIQEWERLENEKTQEVDEIDS